MFGTFSIINIIVLLNLLIAMMNHSYQVLSLTLILVQFPVLTYCEKVLIVSLLSLISKPPSWSLWVPRRPIQSGSLQDPSSGSHISRFFIFQGFSSSHFGHNSRCFMVTKYCDIMSCVMTMTAKAATMMMMVMVMLKVLVTMTDKWLWCWWWLNSWRRGGRCRRRLTSSQLWRSPTSLSPSYYHLTTIFVINIAGIFIIIIYPIIISGLQKNSDKQTHSCYMIIANDQASTSWIHLMCSLWISRGTRQSLWCSSLSQSPFPDCILPISLLYWENQSRLERSRHVRQGEHHHHHHHHEARRKTVIHGSILQNHIQHKMTLASEKEEQYQTIMQNLVRRYVTEVCHPSHCHCHHHCHCHRHRHHGHHQRRKWTIQEQRKSENQGVTEDDVDEIKSDISAFRFQSLILGKPPGDTKVKLGWQKDAPPPLDHLGFLLTMSPFLSFLSWGLPLSLLWKSRKFYIFDARFELLEIMRASGMNIQSATGSAGQYNMLLKFSF